MGPSAISCKRPTIQQKCTGHRSKIYIYMRQKAKLVCKNGLTTAFWLFSNFFMNMGRMVIPAIWDVFWDQTDLLTMLVRPPNTLSQKNRHPKKKFFGLFLAYIFSKENRPKSAKRWRKNFSNFFFKLFSKNDMFLKRSPDSGLSNPNFGFSISDVFMKIF